jgi:hypothetical protein
MNEQIRFVRANWAVSTLAANVLCRFSDAGNEEASQQAGMPASEKRQGTLSTPRPNCLAPRKI